MIKYIDMGDSIKDRETGACIPKSLSNRHYTEYLTWVSYGNTPIPEPPGPDFELNLADEWVENAEKKAERELMEAQAKLKVDADFVVFVVEALEVLGVEPNDMLTVEGITKFNELVLAVEDVKAKKTMKGMAK